MFLYLLTLFNLNYQLLLLEWNNNYFSCIEYVSLLIIISNTFFSPLGDSSTIWVLPAFLNSAWISQSCVRYISGWLIKKKTKHFKAESSADLLFIIITTPNKIQTSKVTVKSVKEVALTLGIRAIKQYKFQFYTSYNYLWPC